ncbi:hypothetical protein SEUCBS139899_005059 [Sporothrix eucalyptigena]|uniref:AB hydrolase-1 domain-containing protein n=1 Tax=Sporothrix eucalyptigena TaxID=1812306 RepID=A0ABP0BUA3_9PEZI
MDWFGRASIEFTHAASPLQLPLKGSNGGKTTDLAKLCRDSTPVCQLNPLLFNGHLQTMWTAVAKSAPEIYYRRRIFDADHATYNGTFAVDFTVPPFRVPDPDPTLPQPLPPRTAFFDEASFGSIGSDDSRPMLIVLHGLSGGSYEVYLRHCLAPLLDSDDEPWEIAVVNSRGCAGSSITSGVLFNARATWDIRQVVLWARKTFPNRPLFGLGFSLGANILTNYVGEEGADCPLKAAVVVGNPFDLQVSNKMLQRSFLGASVYETVMGTNMKKLINRHREAIINFTDLDLDRINKIKTLYEFDREVQCPTWGYPTEEAYYRDASSCDLLLDIRIPFLAIQAKDDPIAVEAAVPYGEFKANPYTVLCMTSLGGHLSWFEPGGGRWHAKPVSHFLHNMATKVDLSALPRDLLNHNAKQRQGVTFDPLRRRLQIDLAKE